jgi:IS30 family transposase
MPAERIGMRDAREVIRLKSASVSTHEIARRLGLARSTVRETLKRAETAGLAWPLPDDMTDAGLAAALYASRRSKRGRLGGAASASRSKASRSASAKKAAATRKRNAQRHAHGPPRGSPRPTKGRSGGVIGHSAITSLSLERDRVG